MHALARSDARVLIVDPTPAVRQVLGDFFSTFYRVASADNVAKAIDTASKRQVALVLLDAELPNAAELLRELSTFDEDLPVIIVANARGSKLKSDRYVVADRALLRTEVGRAQMLLLMDRCIRQSDLAREAAFRRRRQQHATFLVGESGAIGALRERLADTAQSDLNVVITGETGVGKTLMAELIHNAAPRQGRLITVEPSTLAPSLFESELFGHIRGAFTGAETSVAGAFEIAHDGTLFLDEIGDLELDLQRKLLRAVENRVIRRVGDTREIKLNVRITAATNRDLREEIAQGRFRADLYQRLNEVQLHIPPLRERPDDVLPLLVHFLHQLDLSRDPKPGRSAVRLLREHPWPGNAREVRTLARRLHAAGAPDRLEEMHLVELLPARLDRGNDSDLGPDERIALFSRRTYLETLRAHGFSIRGTARTLGVPYHTLRSRLRSLDLLDMVKQSRSHEPVDRINQRLE